MKRVIPTSQMLVNDNGRIYHLDLLPEEIADDIILVGDPGRVTTVSDKFDKIEVKRSNRELVTHTGYFNGKRITVLSTGMGTDNIDIVINELDALANIDLKNRVVKDTHRTLNLVRLGTSGALQADIEVGDSYVASRYAVGLDGLAYFYKESSEIIDKEATDDFIKFMDYPSELPRPYVVKSSDALFEKLSEGCYKGITATAPGFYGPQGREVRLNLAHPTINSRLEDFKYGEWKIVNFEMESSALFSLSRMLGHNAMTICSIVANRVSEKSCKDYHPFIEKLVISTLEKLTK